jgi:hypothetical protein
VLVQIEINHRAHRVHRAGQAVFLGDLGDPVLIANVIR